MQDWTTVRGAAGVGFTQDDDLWLELAGYADVAFLVEVSALTMASGTLSLVLETSPTHDELLFQPIYPAFELAVTTSGSPQNVKSVRCPSTAALSRLLRWRLSPSAGSSAWDITFKITAVPGKSRFFVPTDVSGCLMWLRSDLGITKTGSAVSTWADQSGAGRDVSQATFDRQPTISANQLNGQPLVVFDGANDLLTSASLTLGAYTVLMVATGQTATSGFFWFHGTSGTGHGTLYGSSNSTIYTDRAGTVSGWLGAVDWGKWSPPTAKLLTVNYDGTHVGHTLRINGQNQSMSTNFGGDPGTAPQSDLFTIGALDNASFPAATKVAEVIIYNSSLSAADLTQVEEYLRHRYALY